MSVCARLDPTNRWRCSNQTECAAERSTVKEKREKGEEGIVEVYIVMTNERVYCRGTEIEKMKGRRRGGKF